jgi:glutamate:Na+ symporter, ESS family
MGITGAQLTTLMIHLGWLSILLLVGKLIRARIRVLQRLFLPASIIAGFLGLLLGPYILGGVGVQLIPDEMLATWAALPGVLINVVFACLFLGLAIPKVATIWREGGPQFCYGWTVGMGQYIVGVGLSYAILGPLFGVPAFFGTLLEIGFSGGHGTAAGMREAFEQLGFEAGADLGLMSATVGIISAVVFGMVMVNLAARKGYTQVITSPDKIPEETMKGLVPVEKRQPSGLMTVSPDALEPLAFHGAVVGVAIVIGWYILNGIKSLSAGMEPNLFQSFPLFPLAMMGGLLIQIVATKVGVATYFDRKTFNRILGLALDFLVVSAIASIKLDVFLAYFWPFLILMVAGLAWIIFATWFIAPRMLPDAWFERGITEYGMQTGVTAMGLLLLRVSDPQFETPAAKAFGFKQILYEPFMGGGFITAAAPILISSYGVDEALLVGGASILLVLGISWVSGWLRQKGRIRERDW